jgi:hypothetical protein
MAIERRESDLSDPIRDYLVAQGWTVRCEVNDCDMTAVRGEELIVIELKRNFSVDLLVQAIERQRLTDSVYVAIPVEGALSRRDRYSKRWRGIETLVGRLELGLIVVAFPRPDAPVVEIVRHPITETKPRKKPKQRRALLREIAERSDDYNTGGAVNRPIMTAYREQAIFIALCLDQFGQSTPAKLRALGTCKKTQSILHRNVYGWFERLDRGLYSLRPGVREHISVTWQKVAQYHSTLIESTCVYSIESE